MLHPQIVVSLTLILKNSSIKPIKFKKNVVGVDCVGKEEYGVRTKPVMKHEVDRNEINSDKVGGNEVDNEVGKN